ncbi:MAG TPA: hypothetical protein VFU47_01965 [Armatimonadota bacterium]|nr:hypothetical protein [Armatimonadota bacterium]
MTTYQLRDEATGQLLGEWDPAHYPAGERGARQVACHKARRTACRPGDPAVILTGPGLRPRRYAFHNCGRPYRVPGACGHWVSDYATREGEPGKCRKCRAAEGQTEKQRAAVAAANRRRAQSGSSPTDC